MRYLFALLLILLIASGAFVFNLSIPPVPVQTTNASPRIAQVDSNPQTTGGALVVDREDDPAGELGCTAAPNDCSLRRAVELANNDGGPTTITFADHYLIRLTRPLNALHEDGTTLRAHPGQEVHISGQGTAGSIFYITGANVTIDGLRLYGAGSGYAIVSISGGAHSVLIANNVIGDDDAPSGNCGASNDSNAGIQIDARQETAASARAWLVGNIIECIGGSPGHAIVIATDRVLIGQDSQGQSSAAQRNTIRWNRGVAVSLSANEGNTVRNSLIHNNGGDISVTNFNNNIVDNTIR